ncbi:MAG: pyridoxamine 5'-phosphate oxidase family protein, partial [Clostridia bacterium]|nr:pyridoxamine 5'-phosphate oxidase family protein [Clostridia bacterium]
MTHAELQNLIDRSLFADLGYIGGDGRPAIRRVFCVWHRGPGRHLISTNTSSRHVKLLSEHPEACLYFADSETFEGVCLTGRAVPTRDKAM